MGRIGRTRVWAGKLWFFACLAGLVLRIFVLSQAQSVSASPPEADVDRYLDEKERQVIEIANAATANYEIATGMSTDARRRACHSWFAHGVHYIFQA